MAQSVSRNRFYPLENDELMLMAARTLRRIHDANRAYDEIRGRNYAKRGYVKGVIKSLRDEYNDICDIMQARGIADDFDPRDFD